MSGENILIIDDDLLMCKMLEDTLKEKDYNVATAQTGSEGIKKAHDTQYDVIFTDLMLPDMEGTQILEEIKKHDPDAIVIIITAFGTLQTAQKAIRSGAYDYITKPFDLTDITSLVHRAVISRKLNVTNRELLKMHEYTVNLEAEVEKRAKEINLLSKVRVAISTSLDLDEVLNSIVDEVMKNMGLEICSILLLDESTQTLTIRCARGINEDVIKNTKIKIGERISGWVVKHSQPVLITDIEQDPRFSRRSQEQYYNRSLISVPLKFKDKTTGVLNINNKISKQPFTKDDLRVIEGIAQEASVAIENARLYKNLQDVYMRAISALVSAIDAKDCYTHGHSQNVTKYALAIAKELGFDNEQVENIAIASQLHDLGKIGIHDYILTKPGKLTEEEWEEMKQHTIKGVEILQPLNFLNGVVDIVKQHHEKYNGEGYPDGIKGERIKLGARIIAVADSFDAMMADRPYRKAYTLEGAVEELKKCSGTQFDPMIVETFIRVLEKNPDIVKDTYS
jgi:putative nucleotidyltransferase with HDIG domain